MPCQTVLVGSDKSQRFTNTGRSNGGRPPYKRSLRIMKVSFDENELDTIPWDIPPGCCELSVGNNELECVSWDRAEPKLQALICHHNVIQKIHPMILNTPLVTTLIRFDLSYNEITASQLDVIGNLRALLHLNLSNNRINYLPPRVFTGLSRLKSLNLNRNTIQTVESLEGLVALEQLSLRSNAISHIALHTADLPYLTHLDLSDNTIASITVIKQARRLLRRVVVLDLSHNPITKDLYSKFTRVETDFYRCAIGKVVGQQLETLDGISMRTSLNYVEPTERNDAFKRPVVIRQQPSQKMGLPHRTYAMKVGSFCRDLPQVSRTDKKKALNQFRRQEIRDHAKRKDIEVAERIRQMNIQKKREQLRAVREQDRRMQQALDRRNYVQLLSAKKRNERTQRVKKRVVQQKVTPNREPSPTLDEIVDLLGNLSPSTQSQDTKSLESQVTPSNQSEKDSPTSELSPTTCIPPVETNDLLETKQKSPINSNQSVQIQDPLMNVAVFAKTNCSNQETVKLQWPLKSMSQEYQAVESFMRYHSVSCISVEKIFNATLWKYTKNEPNRTKMLFLWPNPAMLKSICDEGQVNQGSRFHFTTFMPENTPFTRHKR